MIWNQVTTHIEDGDAIIAWAVASDTGYDFDTCGSNRRRPTDLDGFKLVSFLPESLDGAGQKIRNFPSPK